MYFDRDSYQKSARRAREERWRVRGRARVVHPKYGAVVVPHRSNYSALLNAAEYWGCEWTDIRDAEVWAVPPGTAIDKYAIQTTQHNFPDTVQLGDAFQVRDEEWRPRRAEEAE